jgi:DNA-binding MarR family transcriptional regulator
MARSGADLALLLLGGFRSLADAATVELAQRGHEKVRPVHDFAIRAIDAGADTASELGRQLGVSKQAAAKTISILEDRGYIASEVDQRDARRHRLKVTSEGYALLRTGEEVFDELRDRWAQRIGIDELERLEEALAELGIQNSVRFDAPGWFSGSSDGPSTGTPLPVNSRTGGKGRSSPTRHRGS